MLKKDIRKVFKQKRDEVTASQKMKWDDLILIRFQAIELPYLNNVLSFYSIDEKNEVNSFILTDYLHFRNPSLKVAYPKMDIVTTTMHAISCAADEAFQTNEFGITEPMSNDVIAPEEIDMVIVPLLAIDKKGYRVGYGKGYYDRYLSECRKDCLKVGVSYYAPIDVIDDAEEFDIPLDLCITPDEVYVF